MNFKHVTSKKKPNKKLSFLVESPRIELGSKRAIKELSTRLVSVCFFDQKLGWKLPLLA